MSKSNTLFKKKKKKKKKKNNKNQHKWEETTFFVEIIFKQVLVRQFINLGKQSATHNNHWRQFTIHLNEDWTEAPFLSLKLKMEISLILKFFLFKRTPLCVYSQPSTTHKPSLLFP